MVAGVWHPSAPGDSPTVEAYAHAWLLRVEREDLLSPRTVALYRHHFSRLVIPDLGGIALGGVPVGRLRREIVTQWEVAARRKAHENAAAHVRREQGVARNRRIGHPARSWARAQGLHVSPTGRLGAEVLRAWRDAGEPAYGDQREARAVTGERQFEQARTALSALCTAAVEDGLLTEHPVRRRPGTKGRARSRSEGARIRSHVEIVTIDAVFALAAVMPDPYRIAALVTTFAGLRGGETFALRRGDLRFDSGGRVTHLRVERSLLELPDKPISFGPPKTGAGLRNVAVPELIGEALAAYVLSDVPDDAQALVFTTLSGKPISRSRRSAVMVAARDRVGIRNVTWHALRHTGLTLAASVPGVTVRNLMDRGGHSTPRAALIYQHTAADVDSHVAAGLGRLIRKRAAR